MMRKKKKIFFFVFMYESIIIGGMYDFIMKFKLVRKEFLHGPWS